MDTYSPAKPIPLDGTRKIVMRNVGRATSVIPMMLTLIPKLGKVSMENLYITNSIGDTIPLLSFLTNSSKKKSNTIRNLYENPTIY